MTALLKSWIRQDARGVVGRFGRVLGPWAWTINELWLGAGALAATVAASTYCAARFLQPWQGQPQLIHHLDWYMLYAWGFLSLVSMLGFVQDLLPLPESQLLRSSPVSPGRVYRARFAYSVLFNAMFLVSVTLPPAVGLGLWALEEPRGYFALLPVAVVAISVGGAVVGALLAVPVAAVTALLPRHWVPLLLRPEGRGMIMVWYLLLTCSQPSTPPQALPGREVLLSSWVVDLLTGQAGALVAIRLVGALVGLFFLASCIHCLLPQPFPEERTRSARKPIVERVSFRGNPLLHVELRASARDVAIGGVLLVGMLFGVAASIGLLAGKPEVRWDAGASTFSLTLLLGYLPILMALFGRRDTILHTRMFLLARTSPTPLLRIAVLRTCSLTLGGAAVGLVLAGIHAGLIRNMGEPTWQVPLLALFLVVPCLVAPLMAVELAFDAFTMPWPEPPRQFKTYVIWLIRVVSCLLGVVGVLVIWGISSLRPPGQLALKALGGLMVSVVVSVLVLYAVGRRLEQVEWL